MDVVRREHDFPLGEVRDALSFGLVVVIVFIDEIAEDVGEVVVGWPADRFPEQYSRSELLTQFHA